MCVLRCKSLQQTDIFNRKKTGKKHFEDINRELYWEYYRNYIVSKWKVEKISNCPYKHTPTIKKRECENHMTCCEIIKYLKRLPVFRSSTMFSLWGSERHVVIKFYLSIYSNKSLFVPFISRTRLLIKYVVLWRTVYSFRNSAFWYNWSKAIYYKFK